MASERWQPCGHGTGPELVVAHGDLTKARVDAIVSATGRSLSYRSGVGAAILAKGGSVVQDDCREWIDQHQHVLVGQTVTTRAGMLPCCYVIHAAGPSMQDSGSRLPTARQAQRLRAAVRSALCEADRLKLASIAMPAISSGNFGYPKELATMEIVDECVRFAFEKANTTTLKTIVLMDIDLPTHECFLDALRISAGILGGMPTAATDLSFDNHFVKVLKILYGNPPVPSPTPIELLSPSSADYKRILAELPEDCASRVVSVRRVQVFSRIVEYEIVKRDAGMDGAQVTELEPLYHGTPERRRATAIAMEGFDLRHRRHGRSHGDGVYTSTNVYDALWYMKGYGSLLRLRGLVVSNSTAAGRNTIVNGDVHVFPNPLALLSLVIIDFAPEDRALVQRR